MRGNLADMEEEHILYIGVDPIQLNLYTISSLEMKLKGMFGSNQELKNTNISSDIIRFESKVGSTSDNIHGVKKEAVDKSLREQININEINL